MFDEEIEIDITAEEEFTHRISKSLTSCVIFGWTHLSLLPVDQIDISINHACIEAGAKRLPAVIS